MNDSIDVMCLALRSEIGYVRVSNNRIPPELRCVEMPMTRVTIGCVYIMSHPDERLHLITA
jgi:hypothetical protein